ncbi:glutathione S-transferase family protein [Sphingomonas naphthae]|uniref:Glutathione S-transferase family protein n=1 Tax=Sphingomonas naphthae TaxID=1813468 RepID=A0ABY7TJ61_9SPHN|nr:glutathione S-transferase family protein [Sphingomonas naphthae]WCT73252.1 glutathione S-transferase family protein [Sphingomonas naphthae]
MRPILHFHPFSSFCQKVLVALYVRAIDFEPNIVDLSDANQRAALAALWPFARFPVWQEGDVGLPETSIIIEHLDRLPADGPRLIPADPAAALAARRWDRFFDWDVSLPMQKIVGDYLRPEGSRDPYGVGQARAQLLTAYGIAETQLAGSAWAAGETFTIADCSAAPALHYADLVLPIGKRHPALTAYLARLRAHPAVARMAREAEPYAHYFPVPRDT